MCAICLIFHMQSSALSLGRLTVPLPALYDLAVIIGTREIYFVGVNLSMVLLNDTLCRLPGMVTRLVLVWHYGGSRGHVKGYSQTLSPCFLCV